MQHLSWYKAAAAKMMRGRDMPVLHTRSNIPSGELPCPSMQSSTNHANH